jgi:hypothetical protein
MERDPPDDPLVDLEADAAGVVGADWQRALDRTLLDNLGKYRRYDGSSVRDLLRVLRNKVREKLCGAVEAAVLDWLTRCARTAKPLPGPS